MKYFLLAVTFLGVLAVSHGKPANAEEAFYECWLCANKSVQEFMSTTCRNQENFTLQKAECTFFLANLAGNKCDSCDGEILERSARQYCNFLIAHGAKEGSDVIEWCILHWD